MLVVKWLVVSSVSWSLEGFDFDSRNLLENMLNYNLFNVSVLRIRREVFLTLAMIPNQAELN